VTPAPRTRRGGQSLFSRAGHAISVQFARAADASLSRDGGPLRSDGRWARVLPFAAIALMAVVLTLIPTGPADAEGAHIDAAVWSAMLFAVLVLAAILLPWDRFSPNLQVVIPFGYMVVVLLLRHAQGSGDAGYTILYILPIVWLALYSPTWQLITGFCIAAVFILAPPLVDGPLLGEQHYPAVDVALTVIVLLIIAFVGGALRLTTDAASIDVLTGLPNRRVFMARLRRGAAMARPDHHPMSVAILDLDHFKRYNDSHGHDAGDRLLEATSLQWRSIMREQDTLARIGGEEFGLLVEADVTECRALAQRLIESVPHGQTASAGVAAYRAGDDASDALRRADGALYAAKAAGRARVMEASP